MYFILIYFKNILDILEGKLVNKNAPKYLLGPIGPVEVFFYWPEAVMGNFHWPGAIGPLLASSPDSISCYTHTRWVRMFRYMTVS